MIVICDDPNLASFMIIDPSGPIFSCGAATGAGLTAGAGVGGFFGAAADFTESLLADSATFDLH